MTRVAHGTAVRSTGAACGSRPFVMAPASRPSGVAGGLVVLSVLVSAPGRGGGAQAAEGAASSSEPQDALGRAAEWITSGLEAAGIAAILLGVLATTAVFLRDGLRAGGGAWEDAYERYRADLGRAILLGLELLVAADIVGTVAAPLDLRSVAALGLIVLIRTFLSFSLEVEIKGRWPWREGEARPRGAPPRPSREAGP
jgi:uncharacterized membrane protein